MYAATEGAGECSSTKYRLDQIETKVTRLDVYRTKFGKGEAGAAVMG